MLASSGPTPVPLSRNVSQPREAFALPPRGSSERDRRHVPYDLFEQVIIKVS
jgi:hypothetical protein